MSDRPVIYRAKTGDQEVVTLLFLQMLTDLAAHGHDLLPTAENAEWFWNEVFEPGIRNGDPVLIATVNDTFAGALFWTVNHPPYEVRYRTATGWGTYVGPSFRRQGIATALRYEATRILKALGVEKLIGTVMVGNEVSVAASKRHGLVDIAYVQQLDIT